MAPGSRIPRLSLAIASGAFVVLAGAGAYQLWKDGSFWLDEASLALSLLQLGALESFGPLVGDQSFPRLYLLAVRGVVAVCGYETLVVRSLPHLFYLAATAAWLRLLYERFRDRPLLMLLAALLLAVPATWLVYAAMFKSYSLDVLLAAVPFLLRDGFYEDTLVRGRRRWRLVLLGSLGALSYPFPMALLARTGAWWLVRAAAGSPRVLPGAAAGVTLALALAGAWVWAMDLRHTAAIGDFLARFWSRCYVGNDQVSTLALLERFCFGWFDGRADFSRARLGAAPLALLQIAFGVGLVRIGLGLVPRARLPQPESWGSRSHGHALLLAGLPLASWLTGYPICAGRLTLFTLLSVVFVILEGLDAGAHALSRLPGGRVTALLAGVALAGVIAPASHRNLSMVTARRPPGDLRPLLERTRERGDLPILTTTCTRKEIETLPEGIPAEVVYLREGAGIRPAGGRSEAWLLYDPVQYCTREIVQLRRAAAHWEPHHTPADRTRLVLVGFDRVR